MKRLLTEIEAADYLAVSRSYLRQSRSTSRPENSKPGPRWKKIGSMIRYEVSDLDAWIDGTAEKKGWDIPRINIKEDKS
jgi:predicted DNA-binding transcriptional regulator AlpA